jgi:hypothetical protein
MAGSNRKPDPRAFSPVAAGRRFRVLKHRVDFWALALLSVAALGLRRPLEAQTPVSVEAVLASAQTDRAVVARQQQVDFQKDNQTGLPFFNSIGFRGELNRLTWERQEYLGRINMNGLGEMRGLRAVQQAETELAAAEKQAVYYKILYERYLKLAEYHALQQEMGIRRKLLPVYADQLRVLEQTAALNAGTDLKAMLNVEFDRDEQTLRLGAGAAELAGLLRYFSQCMVAETVEAVDTAGWIDSDQMALRIRETGSVSPGHPYLLEKTVKLARIQADYRLDDAKSKQVFDFFQVRYADRPEEDFRAKMNIGIGFNLPYNGTLRVQKAKNRIEQNGAALDLQLYRERLQIALDEAKREFEALYEQKRLMLAQIRETEQRFNGIKTTSADRKDIEALLQLEALRFKRALRLCEVGSELTQRYLEVMFLSGRLSEADSRHFLRGY